MLTLAPDVARVALVAFERGLLERVAAQVGEMRRRRSAWPRRPRRSRPGWRPEHGSRRARGEGVRRDGPRLRGCAGLGGVRLARRRGWRPWRRRRRDGAGAADLRECGCAGRPRSAAGAAAGVWGAAGSAVCAQHGRDRVGGAHPDRAAGRRPRPRRTDEPGDRGAPSPLSPRTVQTHVSHILTKLGARSRVEVAATAPAGDASCDGRTSACRRMSRGRRVSANRRHEPAPVVLGFLPWIAFSFAAQRLSANGVAWAATIAVAMSLVAVLVARRRHGPKILNIGSLVLFAVIAVAGFLGGPVVDQWLFEWGRPLVGVVLGLYVLATVPVMPFTEEYARPEHTTPVLGLADVQEDQPGAERGVGAAILLMGGRACSSSRSWTRTRRTSAPAARWTWCSTEVVPIVVIWAMIKFTAAYPDRVRGSGDGPSVSAPGGRRNGLTPTGRRSAAAAAPAAPAAGLRGRHRRAAGTGTPAEGDGVQQLDRVGVSGRARRRVTRGAHGPVDLERCGTFAAAEVVARHAGHGTAR